MTTMGKYAIDRNYFESDQEFKEPESLLVPLYEEAARQASRSAKLAVSKGELKYMRAAQWDEAVARTIERCLSRLLEPGVPEGDLPGLPEYPSFE